MAKKQTIVKAKLPCILTAADYHDFYHLDELLSFVTGKKVKYKEIGVSDEDDEDYVGNEWRAVFYTGRFPSKEVIKNLEKTAFSVS